MLALDVLVQGQLLTQKWKGWRNAISIFINDNSKHSVSTVINDTLPTVTMAIQGMGDANINRRYIFQLYICRDCEIMFCYVPMALLLPETIGHYSKLMDQKIYVLHFVLCEHNCKWILFSHFVSVSEVFRPVTYTSH